MQFKAAESLVTIRFDQELTGLAEIVRTIEDGGSIVSSIARRPAGERLVCRRPAPPDRP